MGYLVNGILITNIMHSFKNVLSKRHLAFQMMEKTSSKGQDPKLHINGI